MMNIEIRRVWVFVLAAIWIGNVSAQEDQATRGARLAKERCAKCHGVDGYGVSADYPSLAGQHQEYFVKQIFNFKTGQRYNEPMNPVIEQLLAVEIRALSHHFAALPPGSVAELDPVLLAEGRAIFQNGVAAKGVAACKVCHGADAKGGAHMPRLAGQNPVYLEKQLRGFIRKTRQNDRLMHFSLNAMSRREIRAVAAYLGNEK